MPEPQAWTAQLVEECRERLSMILPASLQFAAGLPTVRGLELGQLTLTAEIKGVQAQAAITIVPQSLRITPAAATLLVGHQRLPGSLLPDGNGGVLATWEVVKVNPPAEPEPYKAAHLSSAGAILSTYTMPYAPTTTTSGAYGLPPPPSLVLGESGTAFAAYGNNVASFDLASGAANWNYDAGSAIMFLGYNAGAGLTLIDALRNQIGISSTGATDWSLSLAPFSMIRPDWDPMTGSIYDALDDLVDRLKTDSNLRDKAQQFVLDPVSTRWEHPLPVAAFLDYLDGKGRFRPHFYDGTRSTFCYNVLKGGSDGACKGGYSGTKVMSVFPTGTTTAAVTGTPHNPLYVFFNPALIGVQAAGRNLGNEALVFHEALHGLTGLSDQSLLIALGWPFMQPSCTINVVIQRDVLVFAPGLDAYVAMTCARPPYSYTP